MTDFYEDDEPVEDVIAAYDRGIKGVTAPPDDGLTCDCHARKPKGWKGKLPVALDGDNWPLGFAAKIIGCSEKDLRDLIRMTELEPAGTMKVTSFARSGRHPRAYDANKLVRLWQGIRDLAESIHDGE